MFIPYSKGLSFKIIEINKKNFIFDTINIIYVLLLRM